MIDEVHQSDSRFAAADQVAMLAADVARLDARFAAVDAQLVSLRRENRPWFGCLFATVGVLRALSCAGVL